MKQFLGFALLPFLLFFPFTSKRLVATTPAEMTAEIVKKIETRRGNWIAMKADLHLYFLEGGHRAACRAELAYQRLEERILLKGYNAKEELLFVFKTNDRNFEIYLPKQRKVYRGDIFTLEDSPDIESTLKPLDLYRALKPMAIPLPQTEIKNLEGGNISLRIMGMRQDKPYLARRILATKEGDVQVEIYYSFEEKPMTIIRRSNFKENFARRIVIKRKTREQTLVFDRIEFFP